MADDEPRCTLVPPPAISTCYCTRREGCPMVSDDDLCEYCEEPDCLGDCWGEEDSLPADADYAWRDGRAVLVETVADISTWGQA